MLPIAARCAVALLALAGLCACGEPAPLVTVNELRPTLPTDRTCLPGAPPDSLEVRALGDFPSGEADRFVDVWSTADGRAPIDRFPLETRVVTVRTLGTWQAGGAFRVPEGDSAARVLLLPFGRTCGLSDPEVFAPPGSVAVALPRGGALIAGGLVDGASIRRVVHLSDPAELAGVPDEALDDPRAFATATVAGNRVVIAGGRWDRTVLDTFDVFDATSGRFSREADEPLPAGRFDHGAAALADARVLLVGGRGSTDVETVLGTAVIIDENNDAHEVSSQLVSARARPQVLTLDDGRVLVAGGELVGGARAALIERFDPDDESFIAVAAPFDVRAGVSIALPGARVAWLEPGDARVQLRLFASRDVFDPAEAEALLERPLPDVFDVGAVAVLADGDLVIAGRTMAGAADHVRVDLGTAEVRELDATAALTRLVALADGSLLAVGPSGAALTAALRREHLRTQWDNPPATLLAEDAEWLALDAASRWSDPSFPARRAFLPTLRFERVRVVTRADGPLDLHFENAAGDHVRVVLDPGRAEVGLCAIEAPPGVEIQVERVSGAIALRAGETERRCEVALEGPVALSWSLLEGTPTRGFAASIERL